MKPHSCDTCGKTFKRPQDLKKHERIHTEQHHLQHRHSKAVTVEHQRPYGIPDSTAYNNYHLAAAQAAGASAHQAPPQFAYPFPQAQGSQGQAIGQAPSYSSPYASYQQARAVTPGFSTSSASSASLSPLSSHLDTPQNRDDGRSILLGGSPVTIGQAPHVQGIKQDKDNSYLALATDELRAKAPADPNSYAFYAHGASAHTSSLGAGAGTKRGHDQVAVDEFFNDIRRKRLQPVYDSGEFRGRPNDSLLWC